VDVLCDVRLSRISAVVVQDTAVQRRLGSDGTTVPPRVGPVYRPSDMIACPSMLMSCFYQAVRLARFLPLGRYGQLT